MNTCGKDVREIVSHYPLYNELQGVYTRWGDIALPWSHEDSTSDERWQIANFTDTYSYSVGDIVYRFENNGYQITLYKAVSNIPAPAGAFDPSLWNTVCSVTVSEPAGLPDIETLRSQYEYYDLSLEITQWSDFETTWSTDLTTPDSDQWGEAKIAKEYFYKAGDIVLYDTNCGDYTCVYVATGDIPATPNLIVPGPPSKTYWSRLYCVPNGSPNTCTKRVKCDGPNRQLVSLSSGESDLICVPVESNTGIRPNLV